MREIKFRCYDTSKKVLYPPSSIWKMNLMTYEDNYNLKLMQYTGLKDKNGIEIYEGDIVQDSSSRLMVVEWDDRIGTSRFIFKTLNEIGHIKTGRYLNTNKWVTSYENDIQAIGNIYENKDLLN